MSICSSLLAQVGVIASPCPWVRGSVPPLRMPGLPSNPWLLQVCISSHCIVKLSLQSKPHHENPHSKGSSENFCLEAGSQFLCRKDQGKGKDLEVQTGLSHLVKLHRQYLVSGPRKNIFRGGMTRCLPLKHVFQWSRNPSEISVPKVKLESFHLQTCKLFLKSVTLKNYSVEHQLLN